MIKKGRLPRIWLLSLLPLVVFAVAAIGLRHYNFQILNPAGQIAQRERSLIMITVGLGLLVVIPVFVMTYAIAWKYREGNAHAKYQPEFDHHRGIEAIWWLIPCVIIFTLAGIAWRSSHQLDPYQRLAGGVRPLQVQVIALEWRWLFIYPEQGVATLNHLMLPAKTPIDFDITADAPMNSFWIPQLGGQIYAMPGMDTHLHLIADQTGQYRGSSANISGSGFAGMTFTANALTPLDFDKWVRQARSSTSRLDVDEYLKVSRPSTDHAETEYSMVADGLYDKVLMKYMKPGMELNREATSAR